MPFAIALVVAILGLLVIWWPTGFEWGMYGIRQSLLWFVNWAQNAFHPSNWFPVVFGIIDAVLSFLENFLPTGASDAVASFRGFLSGTFMTFLMVFVSYVLSWVVEPAVLLICLTINLAAWPCFFAVRMFLSIKAQLPSLGSWGGKG